MRKSCAERSPAADVNAPAPPPSTEDRTKLTHAAMDRLRRFVQEAQSGFPGAAAYRAARRAVLEEACGGDELVFYAAWNRLVAEGVMQPLLRAPIGSVLKPAHRRPVAIVPRVQLTPQLAEGRIVLDLGDDRFWLSASRSGGPDAPLHDAAWHFPCGEQDASGGPTPVQSAR